MGGADKNLLGLLLPQHDRPKTEISQAINMTSSQQRSEKNSIGNAPVVNRGRWEHFPHDADVGVRGLGATLAEAFEQAALALTAVVTQAEIKPLAVVEVTCQAPDVELLFVDWLNAIIYEMAVRKMLFGRFAVTLEGKRLHGTLSGEPVDVERHAPAAEPKGATYTALKVAQQANGLWSAACVVDV